MKIKWIPIENVIDGIRTGRRKTASRSFLLLNSYLAKTDAGRTEIKNEKTTVDAAINAELNRADTIGSACETR